MRQLSIKLRVTIWYTLLVAMIALLAFVALRWSAERMTRSYYLDALAATAQLARDDIRVEDGELEIDRNLDELPEVRVALFDLEGNLLYGKLRFDLPFAQGEMRQAQERSGGHWYVQDTLLTFDDAQSVWLRCYISSDAATHMNAMRVELLAVILPALVLLAGAGGYLIARRAFRPVARIAATAEGIADGKDLKKRIALRGAHDELFRIAQVFDAMLDRLQRSFERERRFTSDVSHELRTPVAAILAQTDFALSEHACDADRVEALRDVRQRAGQMSELIGKLLALARMDAGQTRVERERIDLRDVAEIVTQQVQDEAARRGMRVVCEADAPVQTLCDQTMILQALLNLAGNAVRYGREGGLVRIQARQDENSARLCVVDDGPGIDAQHLSHLFDRFYQIDPSRSGGGFGLGLPLVRQIAELHGGRVEVHSEPGVGSAFAIILPLGEEKI